MSARPDRCPACRSRTRPDASFCGECGKDLTKLEDKREAKAIGAAALVYVGVFIALLTTFVLGPDELETPHQELAWTALSYAIMLGFGALALVRLGRASWSQSFAGATDARGVGLALVGGVLAFALSWGYVRLVTLLAGGEVEAAEQGPLLVTLVSFVVLPALVEEWMDRGVLWVALSSIASPRTTIVASALLFGCSHGLGGWAMLEVPHRFVGGLILGWLRHRTGSLWPPILAHATLNALATFS